MPLNDSTLTLEKEPWLPPTGSEKGCSGQAHGTGEGLGVAHAARSGTAACLSTCLQHGPQQDLPFGLVVKWKRVRRVHHEKHTGGFVEGFPVAII